MPETLLASLARLPEVTSMVVIAGRQPEHNPLVQWCSENRVGVFRGSRHDELALVLEAARTQSAMQFVCLPVDVSPADIASLAGSMADHAASGRDATLAGGGIVIVTFQALTRAEATVRDTALRAKLPRCFGSEQRDAELEASAAASRLKGKGQDLYQKARKIIPGGTQLLSKRPEMFLPGRWPSYYASARGAWVQDLDGRSYIDMSTNGLGSIILGAQDPVVTAAVHEAADAGSMSTLNAPEEVILAEMLCELHPWAECVRFARSGGEAMSVAVRISRAASGKDVVLFCGYHGWSDWYLAANLAKTDGVSELLIPGLKPSGVPQGLSGTSLPFHFNNRAELDALIAEHGSRVGVIVMEGQRGPAPDPEFLRHLRAQATALNAVFIVDEITSGFRLNVGGAHLLYGVEPDVAVFGKALANGHAMSAVIGRRSVMESAQTTFISSTFWTERIGPAAAVATIRRLQEIDGPRLLIHAGREVQRIWREQGQAAGLSVHVGPEDMPPLSHLAIETAPNQRMAVRTLWCSLMLERGILDNSGFYATCAHGERELEIYERACASAFVELAAALKSGSVDALAGEVAHSGFQRLT